MLCRKRILFRLVLLLSFAPIVFAQNMPQKIGTGIISGKVTVAGKSVAGLPVILKRTDDPESSAKPGMKVTTDASGIFSFDKLPAANYRISVSAAGFYNPKKVNEWDDGGITVNLGEGERADKIEFALAAGAVVTGKLFDERGRPVIEQSVTLKKQTPDGKLQAATCNDQSDDRGVYRCYGLEPGKYIVGAGADPREGNVDLAGGGYYTRKWYPDVAEEAQAKIIEVKTTEETTGIDIKLARRKKGFKAMGKLIDANTSKSVPGIMMAVATLSEDGNINGIGVGQNATSNLEGEFKIEGLSNGKYKLFAWQQMNMGSEYTAKPINIEIADADVTGLEVKLEKGATIVAAVSLESVANPEIQKKFSALSFNASSQDPKDKDGDGFFGSNSLSGLDATNTLHFKGLAAGQVNFHIVSNDAKGFSITRVERNGTPVTDGLTITAGEQVADVRIAVSYSTASIRGEIKVEGGMLPDDVNIDVTLKAADNPAKNLNVTADARGRFLFEGVAAGTYELVVGTYATRPPYDKPSIKLQENSKSVQVANGQEQTLNLVVQIGSKEVKQ